ncbi:MAG: L-rhamnose mutarotase, partial [Flavisolibacter sp.]|nr:L-rhamnose mutarotase [Flavisolibacter sp.]
LITDVTNEDWGCVGIGAGYVRGINIEHNEISDVSYTGISMGWGWTRTINAMRNNTIAANKIHHYAKHMYDVSAIYTLSAQPGSVIIRNYIDSIYVAPYAHDPNHWFYLYTDEGSSYFTVKDNWCPAQKFLQNANGPNNVWENNGPQVADSIKMAAGIQRPYQYLLQEKVANTGGKLPIQQHTAGRELSIIEVVGEPGTTLNEQALIQTSKENGIADPVVYRWNNHWVLLGSMKEPGQVRKQLVTKFRNANVKVYDHPFYQYNRKQCENSEEAKEWDHVLLTANLVKDPALQKEYLAYHATQATKWPEVAKGFCNANFQQLLLFKNERQLMLVISIPKGKSLDELNPKTTENNPKMDEWNAIMKKYQEGILGTKKGEVWVFLEPVNKE